MSSDHMSRTSRPHQTGMEHPPLSEREERILQRFADGECWFLQSLMAKRLLSRNPAAQIFLSDLKAVSQSLSGYSQFVSSEDSCDLWTRISARINAEERGELMLGKREMRQPQNLFSNLAEMRFGFGAAGVAVAALALIVAVLPGTDTVSTPSQMASLPSQELSPVSLGGSASEPIRMISKRIPGSVEVDWMRSDGRVRMMHGADERAPIIWVKRRQLSRRPQSSGLPLLDTQNRNGVVIVNRNRVPDSVTVSVK